jgi:hypothetical protein
VKRFVRLYALRFAVASVICRQTVITLRESVPARQRATYKSEPGLLQDWLLSSLPSVIYGVLSVLFCQQFANEFALKLKSDR